METKKEIRKRSLENRRKLPKEIRKKYSGMITERVLRHPFFECADFVFCYVPFREEADTTELIRFAWEMGKTVAVPKVSGENQMEFYQINSLTDLKPGFQGILEPDIDRLHLLKTAAVCVRSTDMDPIPEARALMLLPGAAFDKEGNRIGYGGGFYDAYLSRHPHFRKIGVAFSVQCVDRIPAEAHDIRVDAVVTELEVHDHGRFEKEPVEKLQRR